MKNNDFQLTDSEIFDLLHPFWTFGNLLKFLISLGIGIVFLFFVDLSYHRPFKWELYFPVMCGAYLLVELKTWFELHQKYNRWKKRRLPYKLAGWYHLFIRQLKEKNSWWLQVRITFEFDPFLKEPNIKELIKPLLERFCEKANYCFYNTNGIDNRTAWELDSYTLEVQGSLNSVVARHLFYFLSEELPRVIRKKHGDLKIEIEPRSKIVKIGRWNSSQR